MSAPLAYRGLLVNPNKSDHIRLKDKACPEDVHSRLDQAFRGGAPKVICGLNATYVVTIDIGDIKLNASISWRDEAVIGSVPPGGDRF